MQSEYVITYTSPSKLRDGVNRGLSATVEETSGGVLGSIKSAFSYNPGGLVPEVVEPASWLLFIGLILALVLLLFVPLLVRLFRSRKSGAGESEVQQEGEHQASYAIFSGETEDQAERMRRRYFRKERGSAADGKTSLYFNFQDKMCLLAGLLVW